MSSSELPERASLEYLKKLAKERPQELRRVEPQAKLAPALFAVAREYGFSSWRALELIQRVVEENPEALDRRLSRFEHGQTPLHVAINRKRYDILDLLIELGADLEAEDGNGQTALSVAMLRGDREAMTRLHAAGARQPATIPARSFRASMVRMADSVTKGVPMITVPDVARALDWYTSIGFKNSRDMKMMAW